MIAVAPRSVYRYGARTLNIIRTQIAGYAGGGAIARELVQNADDAHATWLEFHFLPDQLVVKNGSTFSEANFDAICDIASGQKRSDASAIGTWGTGFLSVYQITDCPELHSSGQRLVFDPTVSDLPALPSDVIHHTEFHFPWRRKPSEISRHIGADPWDNLRIASFCQEVCREATRVLFFLRHLDRIAVFQNSLLVTEVERHLVLEEYLAEGSTRRQWKFDVRAPDRDPVSEVWMNYRVDLERSGNRDGGEEKDAGYGFAFGPENSVLFGDEGGLLYNYLPTQIYTGLPFHINGDFHPDANRKSILTDSSSKAAWNREVIGGIGTLFAASLEALRDASRSPAAFYHLFPVETNHEHPFLRPLVDVFQEQARQTAIIQTTDGEWTTPPSVRTVVSDRLHALTQDYLPGICPHDLPDSLSPLLRKLGAQPLNVLDYLEHLRLRVPPDATLADAPAILNSRLKLDGALAYLSEYAEGASEQIKPRLREAFRQAPLCLDTLGRLAAPGITAIWAAGKSAREILPAEAFRLLEWSFQQQYDKVLRFGGVPTIGLGEVVSYLATLSGECVGKHVDDAALPVRGWERLGKIHDYIPSALGQLGKKELADLAMLPLCPDQHGQLHPFADNLWSATDDVRNLLGDAGFLFVHPQLQVQPNHRVLLDAVGIQELTPSRLTTALGSRRREAINLDQASAPFASVERLRRLYGFFRDHAVDLTDADRNRLRQLSFVLSAQGNLKAIDDPVLPLRLPPRDAQEGRFDDILRLDNLISDQALGDGLRDFFERTLAVDTIDLVDYVKNYLGPRYNDANVTDEARLRLLRLVSSTYHKGSLGQREEIVQALKTCRLIRCADSQYHRARETYFPLDVLSLVFPHGYNVPHICYGLVSEHVRAKRDAARGGPPHVRSPWYPLFQALGMQEEPGAADIVTTVRQTLQMYTAPSEEAMAHLRQIYELLDDRWGDRYQESADALKPLLTLPWLPADGDVSRWYRPAELHSISLRQLVASQVKLLAFRTPRQEIASFLGIKTTAQIRDVVNHLKSMSARQLPVVNQVYRFLNDAADAPEITYLRGEAVVYDQRHQRFWKPENVFFGNLFDEFGDYRCYLADDADGWRKLFTRLGVREQPHAVDDHVKLLHEIGTKYGAKPLDEKDRQLVLRALQRLARALDAAMAGDETPAWLDRLVGVSVIPDQEGHLRAASQVFFKDRDDLLAHFPDGVVRLAQIPPGADSLRQSLGICSLSEAVKRERSEILNECDDGITAYRIHRLAAPFARVIWSFHQDYPNGWCDANDFKQVKVRRASNIEVRYVIPTAVPPIYGTSPVSQGAYYDAGERILYVATPDDTLGSKALAREIVSFLNPTIKPQVLMSLVRDVLRAAEHDDAEEIERVLDDAEIARPTFANDEFQVDEEAKRQAVARVRTVDDIQDGDKDAASDTVSGNGDQGEWDQAADATAPWASPPGQETPTSYAVMDTTRGGASNTSAQRVWSVEGAELSLAEVAAGQSPAGDSPPFKGDTRPEVPRISTNYYALAARYGLRGDGTVSGSVDANRAAGGADGDIKEEEETARHVDQSRFVLSFMARYAGFLPLTKQAGLLLAAQNDITAITDLGQSFPLYLDHDREIIYNQAELPKFFAANNIPAGGIVYLGRQHGSTFRLFFSAQPHIVRNVRLAELGDDGQVIYTVVQEMKVGCETDGMVFLAEKRLEDRPALFAEAVGKKSVFETLCTLFETNPASLLHEDDLFHLVYNQRMIAASTVRQELRSRPCFVHEGSGNWRFDPQRGLKWEWHEDKPSIATSRNTLPHRETPNDGLSGDIMRQAGTQTMVVGGGSWVDVLSRDVLALRDRFLALTGENGSPPVELSSLLTTLDVFRQAIHGLLVTPLPTRANAADAPAVVVESLEMKRREIARRLLDEMTRNPGDGDLIADFRQLFAELLDEAIAGDEGAVPALAPLLEDVNHFILRDRAIPIIRERRAATKDHGNFAAAAALVGLEAGCLGEANEQELAQIKNLAQAEEYWQLTAAAQGSEEELGLLTEALRCNPDHERAHQRYSIVVRGIVEARLASPLVAARRPQDKDPLQEIEEVRAFLQQHEEGIDNASSCWDLVDESCIATMKRLWRAVQPALSTLNASGSQLSCEARLNFARLYNMLRSATLKREWHAGCVSTLAGVGDYYTKLGKWAEAIIAYSAALELDPAADVQSRLAMAYAKAGLAELAERVGANKTHPVPFGRQRRLPQTSVRDNERFLRALEDASEDAPLVAAVGKGRVDALIKRQKQVLGLVGRQ